MAQTTIKKGNDGSNNKSRGVRYICTVPKEHCSGKLNKDESSKRLKCCTTHSSSREVKRCKAAYLRKQGFIQIGSKEFINPENGYVRVISNKASRSKPGKGDRYMNRILSRSEVW
jgi:hypothetical protein